MVDYFAYGSNLSLARITQADRAPTAIPLHIARLTGHTLRFHKRGRLDGTGKCNAFRTGVDSDQVFGVIYRLTADDRNRLDRAEGEGNGYRRTRVQVETHQGSAEAFTYVAEADHIDDSLTPRSWYLELVARGAREHGLPAWYVAWLRHTATG